MTKSEWNEMVDRDRKVYESLISRMTDTHVTRADAEEIAKGLFDLGFEEGQKYVWFQRSGFGEHDEKPAGYTMTVSGGDGKAYRMGPDGTLEEITDR